MKNCIEIATNCTIIKRSIIRHAATCDTTKSGCVTSAGNERMLCSAVDSRGDIIVYLETNADPIVLREGHEAVFASSISDQVGSEYDLATGLGRLDSLAYELDGEDSEAADWLRERIGAARGNLAELETHDRTEDSVYVTALDGKHEARYVRDEETDIWVHDSDIYGDLEGYLESLLGSQDAAMSALDKVLGGTTIAEGIK